MARDDQRGGSGAAPDASDTAGPADATAAAPPGALPEAFEACLARLEALVEHLEGGALPLEEALAAFEEGVALTRRCADQLGRAERRIDVLVKQGRELVERPFAPGDEGE